MAVLQRLVQLDDPFDFFRLWLGVIVTVYATLVTVQSLWEWWVWLRGEEKYISLLRRYIIVHGLRLRFTTFWGDAIICVLLCVVFLLVWRAHWILEEIGATLGHGG